MTVKALDDDISLLVLEEFSNPEVSTKGFIFSQLHGDVAKAFNGHLFASAHDDYVVFDSEAHIRQGEIVSEGGCLSVVPRGSDGSGGDGRAIVLPALSVEVGGRLGLVVSGAQVHPGERFDHLGSESLRIHLELLRGSLQGLGSARGW